MATSGTTAGDFDIIAVIEEAYRRLGTDPQVLTVSHLTSARTSLNLILREWDTRKLCSWALASFSVALVPGAATVALPADTIDIVPALMLAGGGAATPIPLTRQPYWEWTQLADRSLGGQPTHYRLDRTASPPRLHIHPIADDAYQLDGWRVRRLQDVADFTDQVDIPTHWAAALIAELAVRLFQKLPPADRADALRADLADALAAARAMMLVHNAEQGSWYY